MKSFKHRWGKIALTVTPGRPEYALELPGFRLAGCEARVMSDGGASEPVTWTGASRKGDIVHLTGRTRSGRWELIFNAVRNTRGVSGVRIDMQGRLTKGAHVTDLAPLNVARLKADHLLLQGRSAGGCRLIPLPILKEETIESYHQQMITRGPITLQICLPLLQDNPTRLSARIRDGIKDLSVTTPLSGRAVKAPRSEPVSLFADGDGHGLMEAWAEAQSPPPKKPVDPVAGWNSWDYYRWTISEEAVLKNAEFIAADPVLRRHVKRIIIDDGWEYAYGEWDANPLFPHGMGWMAKRLSALGFEPGLWFAPSIVEPHARIAQWDPDMLARGNSGLPCMAFTCMQRHGFVLDPTVPKARQWIHDLFDRYATLGYRYFKLDFLIQTLKAPIFADPVVPRGHIVRMLVEAARAGMKGRAKLMGCGYDFHAGAALVDEARTSSDIHARWDSVCENVASIATRWWAQGRWWGNDPDFALARGPETSDDPDLARLNPCAVFVKPEAPWAPWQDLKLATMGLAEARTLLSLVIISGGAVNLSDDLTRLNSAGLDLVRRTVAAERGTAGVALDLFSAQYPAQWHQRVGHGVRILLVNWSDRKKPVSLDLKALGLSSRTGRNFWTDEPVVARSGRIEAELGPHASLLVEFKG